MFRWFVLVVGFPVYTILLGLFAPFVPKNPIIDFHYRRAIQLWARILLVGAGVRVTFSAQDVAKLRAGSSRIIVANHQSHIDSVALLAMIPPQVTISFAAKRELFRVPFFGTGLRRAGAISIDRKNGRDAMHRLRELFSADHVATSLIVYPEGTRSPPGTVSKLKKGAFVLARDADVEMLPIHISGSAKVMSRSARLPRPGQISIDVYDPISPRRIRELGLAAAAEEVRSLLVAGYSAD